MSAHDESTTRSEGSAIDRAAVVGRHAVVRTAHVPGEPLQVGNGELAFAADVTGLQTYPDEHPHAGLHGDPVGTLLGTMSQWGWHSVPTAEPIGLEASLRPYDTPRGPVTYPDVDTTQVGPGGDRGTDADRWLRNNPHRLHLGLLGFDLDDLPVTALADVEQRLDLWTGVLTSRFTLPGEDATEVTTAVDPDEDVLAVRVTGHVPPVQLAFPYGSESWTNAADWDRPDAHTTHLVDDGGAWRVERRLDDTAYAVSVRTDGAVRSDGPHRVRVTTSGDALEIVLRFAPGHAVAAPPSPADVLEASRAGWRTFWESGAAVDLGAVADPRAAELERRAVLSQYLTRVNCAGSLPPAETGLLTSSWRGKFHLEMHWWHAAHLAAWGRPELLERSLAWYREILPQARATAERQGYAGVRWPKQSGPEARESPSEIGVFLLWQQPHPIHLVELVRAAYAARDGEDAGRAAQERWADLVAPTADFMADVVEPTADGFALGPPLIPAQESYGSIRRTLTNPSFELAQWRWALLVAERWHRDLGLEVPARWREVAEGMVRPLVRDGRLEAIDVEPFTIRTDHPSMLATHGFLPPTGLVDPAVVGRTLDGVREDWDWPSTWGWDFGVMAMTAARLQRPDDAVDLLLLDAPKNGYGSNGHNYQRPTLPAYLPGNGALLSALALMVGSWQGGPERPGIPAGWDVRHEGLVPAPGAIEAPVVSRERMR